MSDLEISDREIEAFFENDGPVKRPEQPTEEEHAPAPLAPPPTLKRRNISDLKIPDPIPEPQAPVAEATEVKEPTGEPTVDLSFMTINIKKLQNTLEVCCKVPNCEYVLINMTSTGVTFLAKPTHSAPLSVMAYWRKNMFQRFDVPYTIEQPALTLVTKSRLAHLKKTICKNVEWVRFYRNKNDKTLFVNSERKCDDGEVVRVKANIPHVEEKYTIGALDKLVHNLHVTTASNKFKMALEQIEDQNEHLALTIEGQLLTCTGLSDSGWLNDSFECKIKEVITKKQSVVFDKTWLKPVVVGKDLHKSLTISVNTEDARPGYPVMFKYVLDQEVESEPNEEENESFCAIFVGPKIIVNDK